MALDILIRLLGQDVGGTKVLRDGEKAAKDTDRALNKVGANTGLSKAAGAAGGLNLNLEKVRNTGAGMAVVGGVGLAIAEGFITAGLEADRLAGKMNSLLSGAGMSQASGEIKNLANQIAGLTGGDDDQIATEISQAVATGRTRGLTQYGIVISKTGQAAIAVAQKISDLAGRQETLNQIMLAGGPAVASLGAGMSDSAKQIGEFNVRWGNLEESIGMGAARAKAKILGGILGPLMSVIEASPGLQDTAGGVFYIGSMATAAIGGVVSFGSQIAILAASLSHMGIVGPAAFSALGTAGVASMGAIAAAAAPLILALGAIVTAAVAAKKAVEWTQQAQTMSDEDMENGSARQRVVKRAGQWLGESRLGMWMEGFGGDVAAGNEAEAENQRLRGLQQKRIKARQERTPAGDVKLTFEPVVIPSELGRSMQRYGY